MPVGLVGQTKIVITELTGEKRQLIISGRSMPYRPVGLGGSRQRKRKTYYDGNPTATVQALGVEKPTNTMDGKISERYLTGSGKVLWGEQTEWGNEKLYDATPLVRAKDVYEAFEALCTGLQLCRVDWAGISWFGYLQRTNYEWTRKEEFVYYLTWEWTQPVEDPDPPLLARFQQAQQVVEDAIEKANNAISKANPAMLTAFEAFDLANSVMEDAETAARTAAAITSMGLDLAQATVDEADKALEIAYTATAMAYQAADQARSIAVMDQATYLEWATRGGSRMDVPPVAATRNSGGMSRSGPLGDFGGGLLPGDVSGASGLPDLTRLESADGSSRPGSVPRGWHHPDNSGFDYHMILDYSPDADRVVNDPADYLSRITAQNEAVGYLQNAAYNYAMVAEQLRRLFRPSARVVHRARRNEDLRSVSNRYYGHPNRWHEIAERNDVDGSLPDEGALLVIER
jgi:hypothetical protein